MHILYEKKNHQHWRTKIAENKCDKKKLWCTLSGIAGEQNRSQVDDGVNTAEDFARLFTDKIDAVRTTTSFMPLHDMPITTKHVINNWTLVTSE